MDVIPLSRTKQLYNPTFHLLPMLIKQTREPLVVLLVALKQHGYNVALGPPIKPPQSNMVTMAVHRETGHCRENGKVEEKT